MNALAGVLLVAAAVAAVTDWVGVVRDLRPVRLVAKPLTLVLLIGVAVALDAEDPTVQAWFVAGLVLSLAGDVFLLLPDDRRVGPLPPFIWGLASFLLGHVAYVVGMLVDRPSAGWALVGLVVVGATAGAVVPRLLTGVKRTDPSLLGPVVAYLAVISLMVVSAFGRAVPLGVAGALAFYASDATLGWNRFVRPSRAAELAVMITYHLAQALLVVSLLG